MHDQMEDQMQDELALMDLPRLISHLSAPQVSAAGRYVPLGELLAAWSAVPAELHSIIAPWIREWVWLHQKEFCYWFGKPMPERPFLDAPINAESLLSSVPPLATKRVWCLLTLIAQAHGAAMMSGEDPALAAGRLRISAERYLLRRHEPVGGTD